MFSKNNLNKIPVEETPHSTGSRKIIVNKQEIPSKYFEAFEDGDRFIFPPDTEHAIINTSNEIDEFYFFRLKA